MHEMQAFCTSAWLLSIQPQTLLVGLSWSINQAVLSNGQCT